MDENAKPLAFQPLAPVPLPIVAVHAGGSAQPKTLPPRSMDTTIFVPTALALKSAGPVEPNVSFFQLPFQVPAIDAGVKGVAAQTAAVARRAMTPRTAANLRAPQR